MNRLQSDEDKDNEDDDGNSFELPRDYEIDFEPNPFRFPPVALPLFNTTTNKEGGRQIFEEKKNYEINNKRYDSDDNVMERRSSTYFTQGKR